MLTRSRRRYGRGGHYPSGAAQTRLSGAFPEAGPATAPEQAERTCYANQFAGPHHPMVRSIDRGAPMQARRPSALAGKNVTDLDTDGDGSISQAELTSAMEQNAPTGASTAMTDAVAANLFKKIDTNGDGKISTDEWNSFQQQVQAPHHGHHHHHAQDTQDANGQDSSTGRPRTSRTPCSRPPTRTVTGRSRRRRSRPGSRRRWPRSRKPGSPASARAAPPGR